MGIKNQFNRGHNPVKPHGPRMIRFNIALLVASFFSYSLNVSAIGPSVSASLTTDAVLHTSFPPAGSSYKLMV